MKFSTDREFALQLDREDQLGSFRKAFHFPQHLNKPVIYFCGNSLGLQPLKTRDYINQELDDWKNLGVEGHFKGRHPWYDYHRDLLAPMANLVGAKPEEVAIMNTLTVNLHLMMVSFYRPEGKRVKIIYEDNAFPSDNYALQSQVRFHGLDPDRVLIKICAREGEYTLQTTEILDKIKATGDELALVMMGGVNFYSGQLFDMEAITKAAHSVGAKAGFDLAHAAGNVPLRLHNWNIDFAVWCSYKYLNAGPGGVAACFVHEKNARDKSLPRFAGWWGNDPSTRFLMNENFEPVANAGAWQLSNAPVLNMAALRASLELFEEAVPEKLFEKGRQLHDYSRFLLQHLIEDLGLEKEIKMITPSGSNEHGCQLSMLLQKNGKAIFNHLADHGVIADWREPNVIRISPVPLYNSFKDVFDFYVLMKEFDGLMI